MWTSGNSIFDSIKDGKLLDQLSDYQLLKEKPAP
jgi:hypothetical protein